MTARRRSLAYVALSAWFAACLLTAHADAETPRIVIAAAAWGMGASAGLSAAWWGRGL